MAVLVWNFLVVLGVVDKCHLLLNHFQLRLIVLFLSSQKSPSSLLVRCGDWNRYLISEQKKHQDRDVKHISNHPWYSGSRRVKNDISLLHLEEEFILDTHLDTICLPDLINNRENNYEKTDCVVVTVSDYSTMRCIVILERGVCQGSGGRGSHNTL